jgi:5-methylthioadenosine/S-adenosylhomocysteine deaminase
MLHSGLPKEFILKTAGALLPEGFKNDQVLHIKDGLIRRVLSQFQEGELPIVDMSNYWVVPGMSNNHTHCAMNFLRGYTHGHSSMIEDIFFKTESQLTESLVEDLSYPYILSGLRSGVTHFNEHYYHYKGLASAFENMGVRAHVGQFIGDLGGALPAKPSWQAMQRDLDEWHYSDRIKPTLCPHAADTVSRNIAKELTHFAQSNGLNLHFHLAQRQEEVRFCESEYGQSPIEFAKDVGWLTPNSLAVHVLYSSQTDRELLADSGVYIGSCPSSQVIYDHLAPIEAYWDKNPILLGTDCAASNDQGDMFVELNTFSKFALDRGIASNDLYKDIYATATANAADFFKQPMGQIAPNKFADLVFVEQAPELLPMVDIHTSILFALQSQYVRHVMIDGQWALWDREPVNRGVDAIKGDYLTALQQITFPS